MTDVVVLASQVSLPIKLAWFLWLAWSVVQIGWYRKVRVTASAAPRPASRTQIDETAVVQVLGPVSAAPVAVSRSATLDAPLAPPVAVPLAGSPAPPVVSGPSSPERRRRRPPRSVSASKAALESLSTA